MRRVLEVALAIVFFFALSTLSGCQLDQTLYTISFNSNGGSEVETISEKYREEIIAPVDPERFGYTFLGWYSDSEFNDAYTFTTMPRENITLYAKWNIKQSTIYFNSNGGTDVLPITGEYDSIVKEPTYPTKTGYTFAGWYSDPLLTTAYAFTTIPIEDVTLYAKWTANSYTITFNSNLGSSVASITSDYNSEITKPVDPIRTGYTFVGWYSDQALTNVYIFNAMPPENITLYAKWSVRIYTVNFMDDDGTVIKTEQVEHGKDATPPLSPEKENYLFDSWDESYVNVTNHLNIYATYVLINDRLQQAIDAFQFIFESGDTLSGVSGLWIQYDKIYSDLVEYNVSSLDESVIEFDGSEPIGVIKRSTTDQSVNVSIKAYLKSDASYVVSKDVTIKVLKDTSVKNTTSRDLIISEYYEGTDEFNKYIEIYNNTGYPVFLSKYKIVEFSDGSLDFNETYDSIPLSGILNHGSTFIVYNGNSNLTQIKNSGGLASNNAITFDGNDAVALMKNDLVIDVIGEIGVNPGYDQGFTIGSTINGTKDYTVIRNENVIDPTSTFNSSEWTVLGSDNISNIGIHNIVLTVFVHDPLAVVSKDTLRQSVDATMQDAVDALYQFYNEPEVYQLMPSKGDVNVLVIPIEFKTDKFTLTELERIKYGFFGDGVRFETLKSYYLESSYGALNITGQVLNPYQAKNSPTYYQDYESLANPNSSGVDVLIEEIIAYYKQTNPELDLSIYDREGDGVIDAVQLVYSVPMDYYGSNKFYWAYKYHYMPTSGRTQADYVQWNGYEIDAYVFSSVNFFYENNKENAWTTIHETGHLLGLDDYYDYKTGQDFDSINIGGLGGADMMDHTRGDHNPYSKLILDWIDPIVVENSLTVTINKFESSGDAIIVSNEFTSIFGEYFILSYYTPTGLNVSNPYFTESGLAMYHVNSRLPENYFDLAYRSTFLENNNSDSASKLIKFEEADLNDSISTSATKAQNSDLLQLGGTYTLNLYDNTPLTEVTVLEMTTETITLSFNFK